MVRAKFAVVGITRRKHWNKGMPDIMTIELQPVSGGSPENEKFYAATPGGKIELGTVNADAAAELELGAEFYVDFTRA